MVGTISCPHTTYGLSEGSADRLAWSPNGKALAVGFRRDLPPIFWNAPTRQASPPATVSSDRGGSKSVGFFRWSPDGRRLLSGHYEHSLRLWDVDFNREERCVYFHPTSEAFSMAVSSAGNLGASVTRADTIHFWRPDTGEPVAALALFAHGKYLLVSPEGHYQASPEIEEDLTYVVQTEKAQLTLTPEEFQRRYGWKNDPTKVKLFGSAK